MSLYKHVKIILSWSRKEYWLIMMACLLGPVTMTALFDHFYAHCLLCVLLFTRIIAFRHTYGMSPTLQADHQFSWKYLQSLPLERRELFKIILITDLRYITLFIAFYLGQLHFFSEASETKALLQPANVMTAVFIFFIAGLFMSIGSTTHLIHFPRKQFVRREKRLINLVKVRNVCLGIALLAFFNDFFQQVMVGETPVFLTLVVGPLLTVYQMIEGWLLVILPFLFLMIAYKNLLKIWCNEELSYTDLEWKPKRDVGITVAAFCFTYYLFQIEHLPPIYLGSEVHRTTARSDRAELERLAKSGVSLDFANRHGYTPIMIAAVRGDGELFNFLKDAGASTNGVVFEGKEKFKLSLLGLAIRGKNTEIIQKILREKPLDQWEVEPRFTLLHLASSNCLSKITDLLIEHGAPVNAVNATGSTPLHTAARGKCFNVTASLLDAGANPLIKNSKGARAIDVLGPKNNDYAYFLERKTRAPAGK
jgi:ankyrin repeat protein